MHEGARACNDKIQKQLDARSTNLAPGDHIHQVMGAFSDAGGINYLKFVSKQNQVFEYGKLLSQYQQLVSFHIQSDEDPTCMFGCVATNPGTLSFFNRQRLLITFFFLEGGGVVAIGPFAIASQLHSLIFFYSCFLLTNYNFLSLVCLALHGRLVRDLIKKSS